jgi:hypothetical protein
MKGRNLSTYNIQKNDEVTGLCKIMWILKDFKNEGNNNNNSNNNVFEVLRYNPEGRGFHSRWFHHPSGRTMARQSTQPRTEMYTRNIS